MQASEPVIAKASAPKISSIENYSSAGRRVIDTQPEVLQLALRIFFFLTIVSIDPTKGTQSNVHPMEMFFLNLSVH